MTCSRPQIEAGHALGRAPADKGRVAEADAQNHPFVGQPLQLASPCLRLKHVWWRQGGIVDHREWGTLLYWGAQLITLVASPIGLTPKDISITTGIGYTTARVLASRWRQKRARRP
jgi:hypothetical protein